MSTNNDRTPSLADWLAACADAGFGEPEWSIDPDDASLDAEWGRGGPIHTVSLMRNWRSGMWIARVYGSGDTFLTPADLRAELRRLVSEVTP